MNDPRLPNEPEKLKRDIRRMARSLGFRSLGVSGVDLAEDEARLLDWLSEQRHGDMHYMERHGTRRSRPAELITGTARIISVSMDYWPAAAAPAADVLEAPHLAYVSRYALGRDYHKLMRRRLQRLAEMIEKIVGSFSYRAFVDSAPVLEKPLARNAGLGWIGKHTNLIDPRAGSWFFLGELYTDLPLPIDAPEPDHCGSCSACLSACPSGAIDAPYKLDARLCISYLTIELRGAIPVELRPLIGNRIYGCDDCQLVCPWNRFAGGTSEPDFQPRHSLDASALTVLFAWDEATFEARTAGSAIRRIGYEGWLRNIAVALGNAAPSSEVLGALRSRADHPSALVREHVTWALERHEERVDARSG